MSDGIWTLKNLSEEQEHLLKEAEDRLGTGVLLAFEQGQVPASDLTPDQLEYLKELEEKLGAVVISVQRR